MQKPVLVLQNHPVESAGTITDWLTERALPFTIIHTYKGQEIPAPDTTEAVICLGCPHSVLDYHQHEYLKRLHQFVSVTVRADHPYLGICFGGQLLASVFGARVERNKAKEIGTYPITLTDPGASDPLFSGFDRTFTAFHWHNDTFRTPFGAAHLASDENWKHQAFRKERQIGLQFHLEARPEDIPAWCDEYTAELAAAGLAREDVIADYRAVADSVRALNFRFLDNWLG